MSKKAEAIFNKLAGPVSYVKGLVKATREIPYNLKAIKIYGKELSKEQKIINDIKRKRFFNLGQDEMIDSAMSRLKNEADDEIINNVKKQISHLKYVMRPHAKELGKGLIIPGVGVVGTGIGIKKYKTNVENKPKSN